MQIIEKLGVFYLGKVVNSSTGKVNEDEPLFYDSKDLTTHAVCVGMTGSGKTGLGIALLEDAGIDNIPSIIIDPKGDMADLLLTFPSLSSREFLPWVDPAEAERKGLSTEAYAEEMAATWKKGLEKWGEDVERIKKLHDAVDMVIYTPASKAGIPLSILSSFAAPPKEIRLDTGAMRDRILSTTSSLLGLLGIEADPIKSREHILISTILDQAWSVGKDLDIATIIQQVQKPLFDKVGVLDVDTFFPQKDRLALSVSLNNLLASPGFQAWMEGEPLNIKDLLYTAKGKPKMAIISIAHLSDPERMFFVTLLLNEVIAWMRTQSGTSSLRALLYMDEIFGYFPPTAMPPSKKPMLTLLKQARAFGLGIMLATQNPVDLDYKGLSNCGTWFIGKLQTDRDRSRVIEGLKTAATGDVDEKALNKMLALTGNRIFLMRNVHQEVPVLFQTRWTLSYLRGPLTLTQISALTNKDALSFVAPATKQPAASISPNKPMVPVGIPELFFCSTKNQTQLSYKPQVLGIAKLHYIDSKNKIDTWQEVCFIAPVEEGGKSVQWELGKNVQGIKNRLEKSAQPNALFAQVPAGLLQEKNYSIFEKTFSTFLYQNQEMKIYCFPELSLKSKEDESEGDFRVRASLALRERRDELIKKLNDKYADKIATLNEKVRKAQEKMSQSQQKAGWQKADTLISFGSALLGALMGRGVTKGTISQAGTSLKKVGRISKDSQDASQAEQDYRTSMQQLDGLHGQLNNEIADITTMDNANIKIETTVIRPRKSDITVEKIVLLWLGE